MRETVIVSAVRTAMDDFGGALRDTSALELGRVVIEEAIRRAGIEKGQVDDVIMGNVLPAGLGQNAARQAMLRAGLPYTTTALTVNKVCGSGLKAVMLADHAIKAGDADIIVTGGMENMSLAPYYLLQARSGYRLGDGFGEGAAGCALSRPQHPHPLDLLGPVHELEIDGEGLDQGVGLLQVELSHDVRHFGARGFVARALRLGEAPHPLLQLKAELALLLLDDLTQQIAEQMDVAAQGVARLHVLGAHDSARPFVDSCARIIV